LKILTFLKDNYNWCQNCRVPCHFLGANFGHLVTKKNGTATFTKYLFYEKMADNQQLFEQKNSEI
jgi:hypothetical protein